MSLDLQSCDIGPASAPLFELPCRGIDERADQGAYWQRAPKLFRSSIARIRTTTSLRSAQLALVRLISGTGNQRIKAALPTEKARLVCLALKPIAHLELRSGDRTTFSNVLPVGAVLGIALSQKCELEISAPFDLLQIYVPDAAVRECAEERGIDRAVEDFVLPPGSTDATLHQLVLALLPAWQSTERGPNPFFDCLVLAACSYLIARYGVRRRRGEHLAPWQERIAKDLLTRDFTCHPSMPELARACKLPARRFLASFKRTTGLSPNRWLRSFKVQRAKELMCSTTATLAEIALDCGFADQSHFTRVFSEIVQITPAAWRRNQRA